MADGNGDAGSTDRRDDAATVDHDDAVATGHDDAATVDHDDAVATTRDEDAATVDGGDAVATDDDGGLTATDRDEDALAADPTVAIIAAVADNGVIGRDGSIPWHYPADMRRFKETTMGHPVVMGRVTYESVVDRLGEPLPGRTSVVLTSRDLDLPPGAVAVGSVGAALEAAREALSAGDAAERVVYVAGGASVYEQFLPLADRLVLTEIHRAYEGDTRFPEVDWSAWEPIDREDRGELSFVTYRRA